MRHGSIALTKINPAEVTTQPARFIQSIVAGFMNRLCTIAMSRNKVNPSQNINVAVEDK